MYVIDSNILITPSRLYYPHTVVPGFWTWIEKKFASGEYILLDRIAAELTRGNDDLSRWISKIETTAVDSQTIQSLGIINSRVADMGFTPAAINEYFRNKVADQFVIAHAHAHGLKVISEEAFNPNATKKVLIPNVCNDVGVECERIFPWLHSQGLYLVEGNQRKLDL